MTGTFPAIPDIFTDCVLPTATVTALTEAVTALAVPLNAQAVNAVALMNSFMSDFDVYMNIFPVSLF